VCHSEEEAAELLVVDEGVGENQVLERLDVDIGELTVRWR
jgi:hypothetical protein